MILTRNQPFRKVYHKKVASTKKSIVFFSIILRRGQSPSRKIMYIVIRIFILHMQNLIGQKIQRIVCFQETQRFL